MAAYDFQSIFHTLEKEGWGLLLSQKKWGLSPLKSLVKVLISLAKVDHMRLSEPQFGEVRKYKFKKIMFEPIWLSGKSKQI